MVTRIVFIIRVNMLNPIYFHSLLMSIFSQGTLDEGGIRYLKRNCIAIMIQPPSVSNVCNRQMEEDPQQLLPMLKHLRQINTDVIREKPCNGPGVPGASKQAHRGAHLD